MGCSLAILPVEHRDFRVGLGRRHAGLQPRDPHQKAAAVPDLILRQAAEQRDPRDPDIHVVVRNREIAGRDADHRVWRLRQRDGFPEESRIGREAPFPQALADQRDRLAARFPFGGPKCAAGGRLHPEHVEKIRRDTQPGELHRIARSRQRQALAAERRDAGEYRVAVANAFVGGYRKRSAGAGLPRIRAADRNRSRPGSCSGSGRSSMA